MRHLPVEASSGGSMAHLWVHKLATLRDFRVSTRRLVVLAAILIVGLLSTAASAEPITIDFESLPAGPSNFGPPPQTVSVAGATFSGGLILTNESASIDLTSVYATVDCCGYSNPIGIVFDRAIANLSLLVTNNVNATYTLADNLGRSVSLSAPAFNTPLTLTLPFEGITAATVLSTGVPGFDFAIDNVSFTSSEAAPVPEPASMLLVGGGIAMLLLRRRNSQR
jgi:PEP-CTERM motif-containing protein